MLCNSLKLPGFSGGPLTRLISTNVHTRTDKHKQTNHTRAHTHTQAEREEGRWIKLEHRGGRESGRSDRRKNKGGRERGQSDRLRKEKAREILYEERRKREKMEAEKGGDEREVKTAGGENWWRNLS